MSSNCVVIVNRLSGTYSEEKAKRINSFLNNLGISPLVFFIRNLDEGTVIARRTCDQCDNPLIIIGGGDGTINGIVNGLEPGNATLAVLPFGTSNVLAKELEIHSVEDALQKIARNKSRAVPAGLITKGDMKKHFLLMAGIGVDGAVVQGVRFAEKKAFGKGAYLFSALRNLLNWDDSLFDLTADGKKYSCHSLIVSNSRKYAGRYIIAEDMELFEPTLKAVCIRSRNRFGFVKAASMLITGKGLRGAGITSFKAKELAISGGKPVQVDGDYCCDAPVKITIVPDFVRLVV